MNKLLISLFDYTGNASRPYRENGWIVEQIDIKHGKDVFEFNVPSVLYSHRNNLEKIGLIAMIPCTDYATSGAKHFKKKDFDGRTLMSQVLTERVHRILTEIQFTHWLNFWQVENPRSRIHTLNPWLGKIKHKFNPCDYAGYDPIPNNSRYNKETWLWGDFNIPKKKRLEPLQKDNPGWKSLGGKSERTKELRSITPLGFAYAFYEANH